MRNAFNIALSLSIFLLIHFNSVAEEFKLSEVKFVKGVYKIHNKAVTGEIIDYYKNDQLKFRYSVIEGRLHGTAIEFYPNGQIKAERNYVFGKLFGNYSIYFEDGSKHIEMHVDQNNYGNGEKILDLLIAKKNGRKLKKKEDAILVFYDSQGKPLKSSETLPIELQFDFKIILNEEAIYTNEPQK